MKRKTNTSISTVKTALAGLFILAAGIAEQGFAQVSLPMPDHIVVCIMENHPYASFLPNNQIIGNASAPYINALAMAAGAANFTSSLAIEHPSQPNYLDFYSGSNQGITDDNKPSVF